MKLDMPDKQQDGGIFKPPDLTANITIMNLVVKSLKWIKKTAKETLEKVKNDREPK